VDHVFLAEVAGEPVFQYAGIPTRFQFRGRIRTAMVSVDTLTRPDHRRRGLLTGVGAEAYAYWRDQDVPFVVGLPNQQWGSRIHALGWRPVGILRWWARILSLRSLVAARIPVLRFAGERSWEKGLEGLGGEVAPVALRDVPALDTLWSESATEGIVRDGRWVAWRYLESPEAWSVLGDWSGGRLSGVATVRRKTEGSLRLATIGEVRGRTPGIVRRLLTSAVKVAKLHGVARVAALIPERSPLEASALAAGFLPRPSRFVVQAVDLRGGLPVGAEFQGGDFDVV
jgi:hypothetical protein